MDTKKFTFKDTLLYRTVMTPVDYAENNSFYYWILALPYLVLLITIGVPLAIIIDAFTAIGRAH